MPTRAPRPCLDCGQIGPGSRCPDCAGVRQQQLDERRGNSAQRGYGRQHRNRRTQLLAEGLGTGCPRCGGAMLDPRAVDAGHSDPLAYNPDSVADQLECSTCNRAAGATVRRR